MEICWPGKATLKKSTQNLILKLKQNHTKDCAEGRPHSVMCADNLIGLQELAHRNEDFHFIYIDPPYNTGQNFSFSDRQKNTDNEGQTSEDRWLQFMLPRIMWAHYLLRENGVMFVSIDDRQMASLSLLMAEIFGIENSVAVFKWKKKRKPSFLSKHVSGIFEYILVFAKNHKKLPKFLGEPLQESTRPVLNASNSVSAKLLKKGTEAKCKDGTYPLGAYVNRTLGFETLDEIKIVNGCLAADVRVKGRFRVDQETLDRGVFLTSRFGLRRSVADSEKTLKHVTDECVDWSTNEDAESETKAFFGAKVFAYPKPIGMLTRLLSMCPINGDDEFRCLDFFAGSGTLAEAVVKLSSEDKKNRRFVCIQSDEKLLSKKSEELLEWKSIFDLTKHRALKACQLYDDPRRVELVSFVEKAESPVPGLKKSKENDHETSKKQKKTKSEIRFENKLKVSDSFYGTLFDNSL